MEIGWGIAAVWMGLALLASFISIRFKLSIALVEILVGAAAGNLLGRTSDRVSQHSPCTVMIVK